VSRTVAVALGDPAGVGPELVARALAKPALRRRARWLLIGDARTLKRMPRGIPTLDIGRGDPAWKALNAGIDLCLTDAAQALFTAPLSKAALHAAGHRAEGQTEILEERTGCPATMLLAGGGLRVSLVTVHVPLSRVPHLVTRERVLAHLRRTHEGLRRWFGVRRPRIAVLGLNPHAGEGGLFGNEEANTIAPAVAAARKAGIRAEGPLPADGALGRWREDGYDAYLAMYHDQGLTALKAVAFRKGVNVTLGLPFLRTSPDHGTAYALAGTGKADPGPTVAALRLAARAAQT
jgi:4-hydroxythreonine-4-phosphate dehydrogenase